MDEHRGEPIEIELTSNAVAPSRGRSRGRSAADDHANATSGEPLGERTPPWWTTERVKLASVALVAGLVSLLLGVVLGRSTGTADEAAPPSTTNLPTTTGTTTTEPLLRGDALPRPRFPTTTTTQPPARFDGSQVDLGPRLAGLPLTIVATAFDAAVSRLDLATGALTTATGPTSEQPMLMGVGPDWVMTWTGSSPSLTVRYDDGRIERSSIDDPWSIFEGPMPGTFWTFATDPLWGQPTDLSLVDVSGASLGPTIQVPGGPWNVRSDPNGGIAVALDGRNYSLRLADNDARTVVSSYIGAGTVMALSTSTAVLRDCDEDFDCFLTVVDRASGVARVVPTDPSVVDVRSLDVSTGWTQRRVELLSPDGRLVALMSPGVTGGQVVVVDLLGGQVIIDGLTSDSRPVWSPDGALLFVLDTSSRLVAVDVATGETFAVSPPSVRWADFAIRSNVTSTDSPSNDPRVEDPGPTTPEPAGSPAPTTTSP